MSWALGIAIYGAIVSTVVGVLFGIFEYMKYKRKIGVYLEYMAFYEHYRLVVINTGFRPITITSIQINLVIKKDGKPVGIDPVPAGSMFMGEDDYKKLPNTLKDGEHIVFYLSETLSSTFLPDSEEGIEVYVFDAEGTKYQNDEAKLFNPKYGVYGEM